jgi:hypothetical protein
MTRAAMCEGKDKLAPEKARQIAARMTRKDRRVEAYHCHVCNTWHVGRTSHRRGERLMVADRRADARRDEE